ncbi:hypothetical protein D7030_08670 [Flavobacteriaceae bacterium AU392]|nr:hypothetical protein D1817_14675 [Flavobacteriaceae bacterium]RKM84093.1 hypothetical protein D7030_08670 [Flavobacteriaceae bacterium AU392]
MESNFTNDQISDLTKIVEFFKGNVCANKNADLNSCYKQVNHDSMQANGTGIWTKMDFNDQTKLYERISESTFNEIWMFCESTFYPSKIKAKSLCAVATGKYQKYLSDLGKTNPRIAKYAERIEASGDFNGLDLQYQEILNDNNAFDLNNPNIQLILAIHYLSINDQVTRNKDLIELPKEPKFE